MHCKNGKMGEEQTNRLILFLNWTCWYKLNLAKLSFLFKLVGLSINNSAENANRLWLSSKFTPFLRLTRITIHSLVLNQTNHNWKQCQLRWTQDCFCCCQTLPPSYNPIHPVLSIHSYSSTPIHPIQSIQSNPSHWPLTVWRCSAATGQWRFDGVQRPPT